MAPAVAGERRHTRSFTSARARELRAQQQQHKEALLEALHLSYEKYDAGFLDEALFSRLLEKLQGYLESETAFQAHEEEEGKPHEPACLYACMQHAHAPARTAPCMQVEGKTLTVHGHARRPHAWRCIRRPGAAARGGPPGSVGEGEAPPAGHDPDEGKVRGL